MRKKDFNLENSKQKRKFRPLEKVAIFIIVFLVVVILALIFNKQIIQFYEAVKIWYESA
jgi:hypothetical protein